MKVLFVFAFLLASASALAQPSTYHFTLDSTSVTAGEIVNLRVDSDNGCYSANSFEVSRDGDVVRVHNTLSDTLPCDPKWQTPRLVSLGTFEPGTYQVVVETCVNAPSNPCSVWASLSLTVFGLGGTRITVPSTSVTAAFVLTFLVLACGALLLRSTRRL